jgi:uncharacterized membrane protein YhaH (DUF805 family)
MDKSATQWMVEPLKKYATFLGRARRKEYWWFQVFMILVTLLAFAADAMIMGVDALIAGATGYVEVAVSLALFLPGLAVAVRRLHDTDRRGWWLLMPAIPALILGGAAGAMAVGVEGAGLWLAAGGLLLGIVSILLLVWYCSRGTIGENRFGPDPIGA